MEPEGSWPCSQEPSPGPYPKPHPSSSWLDHSNYTWTVKVTKLLIMQLCPASCYFISPWSKYSPQNVFSNIASICPSLNVRDHVSHSYKTKGKIIVLYILLFYFCRQQTRRQKVLDWMVARITRIQSPLIFLLNQISIFSVISKYLNCALFSNNLFSIFM
jgi:hypothetical protein